MKSIIALAIALSATAAQAQFRDGNKLLSEMNSTNGERPYAIGYVIGVADAYNRIAFCPPGNVTVGQLFDMTKQFLESAPSQRHRAADMIMADLFGKAWPCPKRGNPT